MKRESFICPNCGYVMSEPAAVVASHYLIDQDMKMTCPYCNFSWYVQLLIKRVFKFDHTLNENKEVNEEIWYNG